MHNSSSVSIVIRGIMLRHHFTSLPAGPLTCLQRLAELNSNFSIGTKTTNGTRPKPNVDVDGRKSAQTVDVISSFSLL